jgi:hypothetical protein
MRQVAGWRWKLAGYRIVFPGYFDDEAPIIETKGWFGDLVVEIGTRRVELTFYDPTRLIQVVKDTAARGTFEWYGNLVVVPVVNRSSIEDAVETLYAKGVLDV